ncbi:MAG TPA: bifunctional 4-hydroxy-2-oxoglutarate aldolase/2-dehydro-3-deoxy-phosphogluconate aldolase [Chloroflexota bacterium]|nr:bifunctional 4-hydroxy-2-oxoglutarate aldolase/2-dehydro-3-deoxy-phosphogluconate aldolase [Chloroflexota bacterium]
MGRDETTARIRESGVVAIMRHTEASLAVEAAQALLRGGVDVVEVTLNTAGAGQMIRQLRERLSGRMLIGAGTVLSPRGVSDAVEAGAQFIVAPNTDARVIAQCARLGVPAFPGAFTPTEIVMAWDAGADAVKVFPVSSVGPRYIRDLRGPLPHIPLVPTGGVTAQNCAEFIKAGSVAVGAGSDLVDKGVVDRREFEELERRARAFAEGVRVGRGGG